ncbi:hypothetical protein [Nocardioides caldifontis]|uniref:hypothetical protein n=1 Tax=Nocardioides caldifontis TaxID=2588938 RepID=UPI0011DF5474|nr:hypothetical protein [Nocardioides caldifontis]
MSDEDRTGDAGHQPQVSPDGKFVWDGHNWVPTRQPTQQQPQGRQTSPDGRFWWDGRQWVPVQQPPQAPHQAPSYVAPYPTGQEPPKRGMATGLKVLVALAALFAVGVVGLVVLAVVVGDPNSDLTCEEVAEEAVGISDDQEGQLFVLEDVKALSIVEDNRDDYETPSSGEEVILSCEGTGVWDKLDETPVLVQKTIDSDGDEWIRYEMTD